MAGRISGGIAKIHEPTEMAGKQQVRKASASRRAKIEERPGCLGTPEKATQKRANSIRELLEMQQQGTGRRN